MTKTGMMGALVCALLAAMALPFIGADATADAATIAVPEGCSEQSTPGGGVTIRCAEEGGLLRLHLGHDDRFRYEPDSDGDGVVDSEQGGPASPVDQPLTTFACRLYLGTPQLADLSAGPHHAAVGEKKNGIGVRYKEGFGESCGQVNGRKETLTFSLGSAPEVSGKLIDRAEIDIERKHDAVVRLEFFEGGRHGTKVGTLLAGCTRHLSDCGPDSGDHDNFRLDTAAPPDEQPSPGPFDTIVFTNDSSSRRHAAFSLEGGADGTAPGPLGATLTIDPKDTIFHLVTFEETTFEGTLDCGDTAETDVPSGNGSTEATVERLSDKGAPSSECVLVPYNFTGTYEPSDDTQTVDFEIDPSGAPTAQFGLVIDWDDEAATNPLPTATKVAFTDDDQPADLVWCGGTYDDEAGTLAERLAAVEAVPGIGACLAHQESSVDDGLLRVTEVILVSDDPRFLR